MRGLAEQLSDTAEELERTPIAGLDALPGSALDGIDTPRRVAAEVQRLGTAVQDWAAALRRSADDLHTTERTNVSRFESP